MDAVLSVSGGLAEAPVPNAWTNPPALVGQVRVLRAWWRAQRAALAPYWDHWRLYLQWWVFVIVVPVVGTLLFLSGAALYYVGRFVFNKFGGRRGKKRGYFVWERLAPLVLLGGVCFLMSYTFLAMLMANGDVTIGARNAQVGLLKGFEGLVDYVDNGFRIFALAVKYAERLRALVLEVLETSDDVFTAFLPAFQPVFDLLPGLYTLGQEADTTLQDAKEGLASLELSYNRLLDSVDALNSAVYNVTQRTVGNETYVYDIGNVTVTPDVGVSNFTDRFPDLEAYQALVDVVSQDFNSSLPGFIDDMRAAWHRQIAALRIPKISQDYVDQLDGIMTDNIALGQGYVDDGYGYKAKFLDPYTASVWDADLYRLMGVQAFAMWAWSVWLLAILAIALRVPVCLGVASCQMWSVLIVSLALAWVTSPLAALHTDVCDQVVGVFDTVDNLVEAGALSEALELVGADSITNSLPFTPPNSVEHTVKAAIAATRDCFEPPGNLLDHLNRTALDDVMDQLVDPLIAEFVPETFDYDFSLTLRQQMLNVPKVILDITGVDINNINTDEILENYGLGGQNDDTTMVHHSDPYIAPIRALISPPTEAGDEIDFGFFHNYTLDVSSLNFTEVRETIANLTETLEADAEALFNVTFSDVDYRLEVLNNVTEPDYFTEDNFTLFDAADYVPDDVEAQDAYDAFYTIYNLTKPFEDDLELMRAELESIVDLLDEMEYEQLPWLVGNYSILKPAVIETEALLNQLSGRTNETEAGLADCEVLLRAQLNATVKDIVNVVVYGAIDIMVDLVDDIQPRSLAECTPVGETWSRVGFGICGVAPSSMRQFAFGFWATAVLALTGGVLLVRAKKRIGNKRNKAEAEDMAFIEDEEGETENLLARARADSVASMASASSKKGQKKMKKKKAKAGGGVDLDALGLDVESTPASDLYGSVAARPASMVFVGASAPDPTLGRARGASTSAVTSGEYASRGTRHGAPQPSTAAGSSHSHLRKGSSPSLKKE